MCTCRHRSFFQANAERIYIISGGFTDYIWPIVEPFGVKPNHVLANHFEYDPSGHIIGYDHTCLLSQDNGKVRQLTALDLARPVTVIGDGFTDYSIKKAGLAELFVVFTENVRRPTVIKLADQEACNFDAAITAVQLLDFGSVGRS